ncbi:hypothetical protein JCM8097_003547 [Rhodosporidiobolus ruineniae]
MSTRARLPRKATTRVSYGDPPAYEGLSSDEEDEAEMKVGRGTSGRNKGKGKARSEPVDETSSEDDEPKPKRRSKKRKAPPATKQKKGGKKDKDRGKLQALKTLPVELLVEIFSHLNPADLLSLLRTSKTYYALLTAPGSVSLWKRARQPFELPDLSAGGFTEIQYAQLVFGTHCQVCNTAKVRFADFFLRRRICADCRRAKYVRVDYLKRTNPGLHPRAKDCVIETYHTGTETVYRTQTPHASIDDLEYFSDTLWKLQYEDEDEEVALDPVDGESSPPVAWGSTPGRNRPHRSQASKGTQYAELDDDEFEPAQVRPSRRVNEFVKGRTAIRDALFAEWRTMFGVEEQVLLKLKKERQVSKRDIHCADAWDRMDVLEVRVLGLGLGYKSSDMVNGWYRNKLVNNPEPLTDEAWEEIKPKIIKLLNRLRKQSSKRNDVSAKQRRQQALRPHYDKLKKSLPKKAQPFIPLFVDFLLLPSVIPLWREAPDDDQDDHVVWMDSLDSIGEDLEQYRLELALHARDSILEATTDPDDGDVEPDQENEPDLSDGFFAKATSILACSFTTCNKSVCINPDAFQWQRKHVGPDGKEVGTLFTVLQHLHQCHNYKDKLSSRLTTTPDQHAPSPFHVRLPLEIACATSAMLELGNLDPNSAQTSDLTAASRRCRWEWENSLTSKRYFYAGWDDGWKGLLRTLKREVDKGAKLKPPLALEPPVIVFHPWQYRSLPDQAETDDEDDSEAKKRPPLRKLPRKRSVNSDSEEDGQTAKKRFNWIGSSGEDDSDASDSRNGRRGGAVQLDTDESDADEDDDVQPVEPRRRLRRNSPDEEDEEDWDGVVVKEEEEEGSVGEAEKRGRSASWVDWDEDEERG